MDKQDELAAVIAQIIHIYGEDAIRAALGQGGE